VQYLKEDSLSIKSILQLSNKQNFKIDEGRQRIRAYLTEERRKKNKNQE